MSLCLRVCVRERARGEGKWKGVGEKREVLGYRGERQGEGKNRVGGQGCLERCPNKAVLLYQPAEAAVAI